MAIGDRICIVTEKEYRIMSPPRRPRGEKPQTTIRLLRHTINDMHHSLAVFRGVIAEKDHQIAAQDVELSESADRERILVGQVEDSADQYGTILAAYQKNSSRLAYLEGYYDRSQELLTHDPAKTNRGSGAGDQENLPDGAQDQAQEWFEAAPRGPRR